MADVLNQNEIDALLNMVNRGPPPSPAASLAEAEPGRGPATLLLATAYHHVPPTEVQLYDFKRPERVSKEQVMSLEALHETFARNVSASLSGYLRTVVEVRLISVEQFTYSEFILSLPSPTSINLLSCQPLEGNMILEMNPSIIFPIIDRLLGGGTAAAYLLDRPFTNIEQGLVNSILARVLDQLTLTWENLRPIQFLILESESNPFLMQIVAPNEPIVLLSFEVVMGEHSGMINLCIPFKVIEPIITEFSKSNYWFASPGEEATRDSRQRVLGNISTALVQVSAIVAELPLKLADLLTMKPGDILDTGKPVNSELTLAIGNERKFRGRPGTCRGKLAFQISSRIDAGKT